MEVAGYYHGRGLPDRRPESGRGTATAWGTISSMARPAYTSYMYGRAASTVYGGSNEIQKNIIAKGALGL